MWSCQGDLNIKFRAQKRDQSKHDLETLSIQILFKVMGLNEAHWKNCVDREKKGDQDLGCSYL